MKIGVFRGILSLVLVLSLGLASAAPLFADLDDFKKDVESEENRSRQEGSSSSEEGNSSGGGGGNPIARFLLEITVIAWAVHNSGVYYSPYPFSEPMSYSSGLIVRPRSFINYDFTGMEVKAGGGKAEVRPGGRPHKKYWFEVSSGALMTEDGDYGAMASLQGRFTPFFGPDIDYRLIFDGSDELHITTAGLDFSIMQNDFLTWTVYGKGAFFNGVMERSGGAFGSWIRTYPFKPVSLHLRAGGIVFPEITFGQVEAKLNLHLGKLIIFAGINLLESEESRLLMTEAGGSVHF